MNATETGSRFFGILFLHDNFHPALTKQRMFQPPQRLTALFTNGRFIHAFPPLCCVFGIYYTPMII
ncbi:hypothetical protein I656_01900 [Geobacillus sp. WSUCF1]|nr:hypothetical protein I656_01900 [Geobacillus sp. WSUCF1]